MSARAILILPAVLLAITLPGCITEKTVLSNAQGQTITCENQGRIGIVSGIRLYSKQHDCIKHAEAAGYTVTPSASGASPASSSSTS
jgi:hypothetical protein